MVANIFSSTKLLCSAYFPMPNVTRFIKNIVIIKNGNNSMAKFCVSLLKNAVIFPVKLAQEFYFTLFTRGHFYHYIVKSHMLN